MDVSVFNAIYTPIIAPYLWPNGSRMESLPVGGGYTFECQYAKAINTAWNGSLPQANAGDIFIAAPFV